MLRTLLCTSSACLLAGALVLAAAQSNRARPDVERGIIALHYFEYEEANEAFRRAQAADSESVLASWGPAMTYYQTPWRNENLQAARAALARLGPTESARLARARTPKERGLL